MLKRISSITRLPRIGRIRLGEKRVSERTEKEYPAATEFFNFRDVPQVEKVYGNQCREIYPVVFPHDDEEVWMPTGMKAYTASALWCSCNDGVTANRIVKPGDTQGNEWRKANGVPDLKEGDMFEMPCPGEVCPYFESGDCKNNMRLMFMLPQVPGLGVYDISTSSFHSIVNMQSKSRMIKMLTGGRFAGLSFALRLAKQKAQPKGVKMKDIYVLELHERFSLQELAAQNRLLESGGVLALLPEAGDPVPDDLYPHGGAALDQKLAGEPAPPKVKQPQRKARAAVVVSQPADSAEVPSKAPAPAPVAASPAHSPTTDETLPIYIGSVIQVTSKTGETKGKPWTYYDIEGEGEKKYRTFDKKLAEDAEQAMTLKAEVEIAFEIGTQGMRAVSLKPTGNGVGQGG